MDLKVEHLSCLRGERVLFDPLSFSLKPGEGLWLRGPNGSGKSSLLKLLAGLLRPYAGQIWFGGVAIREDLTRYRRHIAYLGHLDGLKPTETAGEAVTFRRRLHASNIIMSSSAQAEDPLCQNHPVKDLKNDGFPAFAGNDKFLREMLERLGMQSYATTPIRYLSAGQRRRVALAGVLASGATLWLLDEPTTALDSDAASLVYDALRFHLEKGGMVIAATHDDPPAIAGARTLVLA